MRTPILALLAAVMTATTPALVWAAEQTADSHAAAEGDQGSKLLLPDHGTAFWTLVLFVFLLIVLGKFVWPVIVQGLDERERKIRQDIEGAEAANHKAQQTLADYERKLAEAHAEARKLVEQARGDAEKVRQRLASETETEIARMRDRAKDEIRQARLQAVQELRAEASDLAVAVAEKILQRQITDADTQAMVDRSLRELDELKV
jgi:F-type H+-transporting ATPase subunit b